MDKMVEAVRARIPDAKFRYKPVPDIMAVVSGYKDWEISCARIQEELGWTLTYTAPWLTTS